MGSLGSLLLMVFCGIVFFGFLAMKAAFDTDTEENIKRYGKTTLTGRIGIFFIGIFILFIAWLFYMIATGQI